MIITTPQTIDIYIYISITRKKEKYSNLLELIEIKCHIYYNIIVK